MPPAALVFSLLLGLLSVQAPLYSSNQNTYFLHAARSWLPGLAHDWQSNTVDAQPLFSFCLRVSHALAGDGSFALWMAAFSALYGWALWSVASTTWQEKRLSSGFALGASLTLLLHAGERGPWFRRLFDGLAGQYILGNFLQPSVAGVLLLAGLALALRGRPLLSVGCFLAAPALHPTYLLPAFILGAVLLWEQWRAGSSRRRLLQLGALHVGGLTFIALFVLSRFPHPDSAAAGEAACMLVNKRIPHHAVLSNWWNGEAGLRVGVWLTACAWGFGLPIFRYLAALAAVGGLLLALQQATGSCSLALLFPQRVTVVAFPLLSFLVLTRLGMALTAPLAESLRRLPEALSILLLIASLVRGALAWRQSGLPLRPQLHALHDAILRFTPVDATLLQLPAKLREDLRLKTGRALVVDWKSHPYEDRELLEWSKRVATSERLSRVPSRKELEVARQRYGFSHIVASARWPAAAVGVKVLYRDSKFLLGVIE